MKLFGTMRINNDGVLTIGGCETQVLANSYGTPLYVLDEEHIRSNCRLFKESFSGKEVQTEVIYASKALLNIAVCRVIVDEGLSLDVVSGGELYTAIRAEYPMDKVYFHGNNKSIAELELAISTGVGRIVVDNLQEFEVIEELCRDKGKNISVLLRVNPGIEAHTHKYIQTSRHDSKFGESLFGEDIYNKISRMIKSSHVSLKGFHYHLGSQIFNDETFYAGAAAMMDFLKSVYDKTGYLAEELNTGGGFGVFYAGDDTPIDIRVCLEKLIDCVQTKAQELSIKVPKLMIEPGRAIVANAGTTLYGIGGIKETFGGKTYAFVDGGMSDNPRTAMYDARYEAILANKAAQQACKEYTVAGKCCESGDVVIKGIMLPEAARGDVLAVLSTGAYNYSMSSNYNRIPRPAMVMVRDGESRLIVRRESYEDLLRNDV